jgi:cell division septum initiation protein DivIVA
MSNEILVGIICALVATHYLTMVWEIRRLRAEIVELRKDITKASIAAASASAAVANALAFLREKTGHVDTQLARSA